MEQSGLGAMDGYLMLADISGYTAFLTGTELEHSHAIVTELTKLIRSTLVPPLRFVKLEGDAVFCFADADAFPNGESSSNWWSRATSISAAGCSTWRGRRRAGAMRAARSVTST